MNPDTLLAVVHRRDVRAKVHLTTCRYVPKTGWNRSTTTAGEADRQNLVACKACLSAHGGPYSFNINRRADR